MKMSKTGQRELTCKLTLARDVGSPSVVIRECERVYRPEMMVPDDYRQMVNSLLAACIMAGKSPLTMGCSSHASGVKASECSDGWYVRFEVHSEVGEPYIGICGVVG